MKEELKQEQENCCTPVGQIKRYVDCHGCDRKPKQEQEICNHCGKTFREQMKGCGETTCYRQFLHKQETLEEVAEKLYPTIHEQYQYDAFIQGAKWMQERMYSEEEVRRAFQDGQDNMDYSEMYGWSSKLTEQEWFNQFKNRLIWKTKL